MNVMRMIIAKSLFVGLLSGCATIDSAKVGQSFDADAKQKAAPYLKDLVSIDFRYSSPKRPCGAPDVEDDWKDLVWTAGACVEKQDWVRLEALGVEMAARDVHSPWGAYFLALSAVGRGEFLRAHWMLDLAERKAGGPLALVRYEKARLLEREEGAASASKAMLEAVKQDPKLIAGQLWLAQLFHRDRMLKEAEQHYRLALAAKSDLYPALVGLSDITIENKSGPEAVNFLSRAILLKPEFVETRVKLAIVYESMTNEPDKALRTLRELRVAMEKGRAKGSVGFDLNRKIIEIEKAMKPVEKEQALETLPRQPAQSKKGG